MSSVSLTIVGFKKTTKFFFDLEVVVDLNNLPKSGYRQEEELSAQTLVRHRLLIHLKQ